jgi:hypothetical protein
MYTKKTAFIFTLLASVMTFKNMSSAQFDIACRDRDGNYWTYCGPYSHDSHYERNYRSHSAFQLITRVSDMRDEFGWSNYTSDPSWNFYRNIPDGGYGGCAGPNDTTRAIRGILAKHSGIMPDYLKKSGSVRSFRNPEEDAAATQKIISQISAPVVVTVPAPVMPAQTEAQKFRIALEMLQKSEELRKLAVAMEQTKK